MSHEAHGVGSETGTGPESNTFSRDPLFDEELERRLKILEATDYDDPARVDLPAIDLVLLAALVAVTTVAMYAWGY